MADKRLDIFRVLRALDARDKGFYDTLTPEEQKQLAPYVLLRWASGVQDNNSILQAWYVEETNRSVNRDFWVLSKHPRLLWMLFTQIGSLNRVRHDYIKRDQKRDKGVDALGKIYPEAKAQDLQLFKQLMDPRELKVLLDEYKEFEED
jgi:hypothetical protein